MAVFVNAQYLNAGAAAHYLRCYSKLRDNVCSFVALY